MTIDRSLYGEKERDERNYDYWECHVNDLGNSGRLAGAELMKVDETLVEYALKKAPGQNRAWLLDQIIVTGSRILPDEPPLGRWFVFKSLKEGEIAKWHAGFGEEV